MNTSPSKFNHFFNHEDNFAQKYLTDSLTQSHQPQLFRQHLEAQIQSVNNTLATLFQDRPRLGQLFTNDSREVQKTIDVIKMLLSQRQRDLQAKNQVYSNMRKLQNQRNQLVTQLEKMHKDLKRLDVERETLSQKLKAAEKTSKQNTDRLTADKDQWFKKYRAIEARENQYRNQIRKQQTTIKSLQEKFSRGQDKGPIKNSFEVMQQLQTYGPTFIMMNGEHEYNQMVAKTMEQNYTDISNENQFLKDTLQNLQKQLQTVLQLKKELMRRRRGYDSQIDSVFQLSPLNTHLINIPPAFSKQGVAILQQNVTRFKEAMKVGQIGDQRETQQKVTCVNNVKNLIRNYKNVVESQEQLLNKVILKAKQFKSSEMQAIQSRNSRAMDQDELERARRFLQQQSNYLQNKNRELQLTRKAMQNTIRKVEQERQQFLQRSNQANEDLSKIKKQVQQLPAIIQHELNSS